MQASSRSVRVSTERSSEENLPDNSCRLFLYFFNLSNSADIAPHSSRTCYLTECAILATILVAIRVDPWSWSSRTAAAMFSKFARWPLNVCTTCLNCVCYFHQGRPHQRQLICCSWLVQQQSFEIRRATRSTPDPLTKRIGYQFCAFAFHMLGLCRLCPR